MSLHQLPTRSEAEPSEPCRKRLKVGGWCPVVLLSGFVLVVSPLEAGIVSGVMTGGPDPIANGGQFVELTGAIGPVGSDNHQSFNLFAFNEAHCVTLVEPLAVAGESPIAAGTVVSSHYVFFDPPTNSNRVIGSVVFDAEVLGIITSLAALGASDFLGNPAASYVSPTLRGLEGDDSVSISSEDPNAVILNFRAGSPGDYVRVITAVAAEELPAAIEFASEITESSIELSWARIGMQCWNVEASADLLPDSWATIHEITSEETGVVLPLGTKSFFRLAPRK